MGILDKWRRLFQKPRLRCVTLFVTTACDARCDTCFYWRQINTKINQLTLKEYRQIAENLGPVEGIQLSGGEPTLREDLPEIVEAFVTEPWQTIALPTNGLKTDRIVNIVDRIASARPDNRFMVGVSLDGPEELNDRIRGVDGIYRAARRTLQQLASRREAFPNMYLSSLTTVTAVNQNVVAPLLDTLADEGLVDFLTVEVFRDMGPDQSEQSLPDPAILKQIQKRCEELNRGLMNRRMSREAAEALSYTRILNTEQNRVLADQPMSFQCQAGRVSAVIEPDGVVRVCEILEPIGQIRDHDCNLISVLSSPEAQQQIRMIQGHGCACTHCVTLGQSIPYTPTAEIRRRRAQRRIEADMNASETPPDTKA